MEADKLCYYQMASPAAAPSQGDLMLFYSILRNCNSKPDVDWAAVAADRGFKSADVAKVSYHTPSLPLLGANSSFIDPLRSSSPQIRGQPRWRRRLFARNQGYSQQGQGQEEHGPGRHQGQDSQEVSNGVSGWR